MNKIDLIIRSACAEDAPDVVKVHYDAVHISAAGCYPEEILDDWSPPVDAARITSFLENGMDVKLVAELEGRIVGFAEVFTPEQFLCAVYVHPDAGRVGVGSALLREIEARCRQIGLSSLWLKASINAEAFYLRHGFQVIARTHHILWSGREMPCVEMRKDLLG